ncbi:MAG: phytoene desaturase family protein [Nocardioidaceae bacterium]
MPDVVVVGAGIGGMAAAARLAKLGHHVTVCERNSHAGGAIHRIERDGFSWDSGPAATGIPALLRDLFRTTGRPLEHYLDLQMWSVSRRHLFPDGSAVNVPTGSRAAQIDAFDRGLGHGAGREWSRHVDSQAAKWDVLREQLLDEPEGARRLLDRRVDKILRSSTSLAASLRSSLGDARLRQVAAHAVLEAGADPAAVPAWAAVTAYAERSFGRWSPPGGMAIVTDALVTRLAERGVDLMLGCEVEAITVGGDGSVNGVRSSDGDLAARIVVTDIDPRTVFGRLLSRNAAPAAARTFATARSAALPHLTHLGLSAAAPDLPQDLPQETVVHGDQPLVVVTTGHAPDGMSAWTLRWRGPAGRDPVEELASRGIDVRGLVVTRVDRSAVTLAAESGGCPWGLAPQRWRRTARRAELLHAVPGLHLVGAGGWPGPWIPTVLWETGHVATRVGKAAGRH